MDKKPNNVSSALFLHIAKFKVVLSMWVLTLHFMCVCVWVWFLFSSNNKIAVNTL